MSEWPRIAVVGAGAVGGYFGGQLALAGAPITMIGRKPFVDAVQSHGLLLEKTDGSQRVKVEAVTEMRAVSGANFVLFCVKSVDTESAAKQLAPFLASEAVVICLQNGVDNVPRIRQASNIDALPAAVYIAVSVPEPGHIKHLARGDLVVGPFSERTDQVLKLFTRAKIPCRMSDNVEGELWSKLLVNCALNTISALGHARYGQIAESSDARKVMQLVIDEVLSVANARGITLPNIPDRNAGMLATMQIAAQMSGAFSSTAQDLHRGKPTEIDSLNGYISRTGAEFGIDVPVNHALFTLVKLAEQKIESNRVAGRQVQ